MTALATAMFLATAWMFGSERKEPVSDFAGFSYVSASDGTRFVAGRPISWFFNPKGRQAWADPESGSVPADPFLEHGVLTAGTRLEIPVEGDAAHVAVWTGDWFRGVQRIVTQGTASGVQRLVANGRIVFENKLTPTAVCREWCRFEDRAYSRSEAQWDRLVRPLLNVMVFEVPVRDGRVVLESDNLLVAAIAAVGTRRELDRILTEVEQARRAEFARRYPWSPLPDEPLPAGVPSEAACLFFAKDGYEDVYPWSRPKTEECTDVVRRFAARGEWEAFRFGVLPLRNCASLEVRVGDFHGPSGVVLSVSKCADLWRETYKERGSDSQYGKITDMRRLDPLSGVFVENGPQPGERGTPRLFVLDVRVPESAAAGLYSARVEIVSRGEVVRTSELRLKVLPFSLRRDDAAAYGFQMMYGLWTAKMRGASREELRRSVFEEMRFLDRYGFANFYLDPQPGTVSFGTISGDPGSAVFSQNAEQAADMKGYLDEMTRAGNVKYFLVRGASVFKNCGRKIHMPGKAAAKPGWFDAKRRALWEKELLDIERIVPRIDALMRAANAAEPLWYFDGELDNGGPIDVEENVRLAKMLRRHGLKTLVTINGPLAGAACPGVFDHVWANPETPIAEDFSDRCRASGTGFGSHNCGDTRFQSGLQFWRTGAEGRFQETVFYIDFLMPYAYLPWNYNTSLVYPTAAGGYRPTLAFLNYRDGMEDYLYLHTLEAAVKRAGTGTPARREAESFLAELRQKIRFDPRHYHIAQFDAEEGTSESERMEWNALSIERVRWNCARLIMALEGLK